MSATVYNWQPARPRGRLPVLNRRSGLSTGLRFAMCPGMEAGFRGDGSLGGSWEDVLHRQGTWEDGPTATCYHAPASFGTPTEDGATPSRHIVSRNGGGAAGYDWPTGANGFITAAVLVRMDDVQNATDQCVFKKRSGSQLATDIGWEFITGPGNVWSFRVCDGATQVRANSTTVQALEANLIRFDMLIAKADGTNLDLWVNGTREARVATAVLPANNGQGIRFFGTNSLAEFTPCYVGMAAQWDRALPDSSIIELSRDPFRLWRHPADLEWPGAGGALRGRVDVASGVRVAPGAPFANFGGATGLSMSACCCCAGSSVVMF
jgi:hypothetical protein